MTIHIDRAVTEVIPLPEPPAGSEPADSRWEDADRLRAAMEMLRWRKARTHAGGIDD